MLQSEHGERRLDHAVRRQADRIDVLANQKVGDFGIVRRGLSADADVAVVALRPLDRELQYGQDTGIAFVELKSDHLGIPIDAEHQLGEIVGADRSKAVADLAGIF